MLRWAVGLLLCLLAASQVLATGYVVDASAPGTSDANAGTADKPFKTISAAVAKAKPGDVVQVKNGTYREAVNVPAGEAESPITLTAWPGHRPVIKGSEVVKGPWTGGAKTGVFVCSFEPYTQMVFVDGEPLKQIGEFERMGPDSLNKIKFDGKGPEDLRPGTFFYNHGGKKLYVWLSDGSGPDQHVVEASVRDNGISTESYTRVVGFDVLHCQVSPQHGHAAILGGGKGVVIESCRALHNDFAGMIVSGQDCVIRNCELAYNGNDGFTSNYGTRMLLEGNVTHHNNTRNYDIGWHAGGAKIVLWENSRFIRHRAYEESVGLWFDVSVRNTLVADSLFEDCGVGIYYEISRWGIFVNNVCRDCDRGIWSYSSDVLIAHNVTDRCSEGITVTGAPRSDIECSFSPRAEESYRNVLSAVRNNLIINNIIIDATNAYIGIEKDTPHNGPHFCDYNAFVWTFPAVSPNGNHIKFMSSWDTYYGRLSFWQEAGYDHHSLIVDRTLYDLLRRVTNNIWYIDRKWVLPEAGFADRLNGRYDLTQDSPLREFGRRVPLKLKSTYYPGKRPWERTATADAPKDFAGKPVPNVTGEHYRVQPEPAPLMMFDPEKSPPVAPGLNREWSESGQYPAFEVVSP